MLDRSVQFPQRYQLKKVEGTEDIFDLIPAPGEVSAEGTLINKATLWKDATAALFGLGVDSVPDDGFAWLGKYNQHWWRRIPIVIEETDESQRSIATTAYNDSDYSVRIARSDSVSFNSAGNLELVSPIESNFGYATNFDLTLLNGKYFTHIANNGGGTSSDLVSGLIYKGKSDIVKQLVSSQGYKCFITCSVASVKRGEVEYVQSSDRSAYPDSGEQDGYEYEYLGIPFDNAVGAPKIETGSYVGTNAYGENNPNILTFAYAPKIVIVVAFYLGIQDISLFPIFSYHSNDYIGRGYCNVLNTAETSIATAFAKIDRNNLYWYHTGSQDSQLNNGGDWRYYYIALS